MHGARQNIGMYVVDYQSQRKTYLRSSEILQDVVSDLDNR